MQRCGASPATENEWQPKAQPFTRRSHYPFWCSGNLSGEDGKKHMIGRKAMKRCLVSLVKPIMASQLQWLPAMVVHEPGWSWFIQSYLLLLTTDLFWVRQKHIFFSPEYPMMGWNSSKNSNKIMATWMTLVDFRWV